MRDIELFSPIFYLTMVKLESRRHLSRFRCNCHSSIRREAYYKDNDVNSTDTRPPERSPRFGSREQRSSRDGGYQQQRGRTSAVGGRESAPTVVGSLASHCGLAKAAYRNDLRLNPALVIDGDFAAAVSKLNGHFWRSGREKCFSLDIPFNRIF
jgi:hypothetical protein